VWALAEALIKAKGTPEEAMYARAALVAIDRSTAKVRAAKAQEKENMLDPKLALEGLKIITAKDAKGALELLNRLLASALGGGAEAEEPAAEEPAAEEPAAEPMPAARVVVAPGEDALAALGRAALALTGVSDPGEAIAEMARRSALAVGVEEREAAVARDRAVLELTERKALVANLVTLRAETPHTSGLATGTLVPRLLAEPIADLRARVVALGGSAPKAPAARVVPGTDPLESLSDRERAMCAEMKLDPATYAAHKARKVG